MRKGQKKCLIVRDMNCWIIDSKESLFSKTKYNMYVKAEARITQTGKKTLIFNSESISHWNKLPREVADSFGIFQSREAVFLED